MFASTSIELDLSAAAKLRLLGWVALLCGGPIFSASIVRRKPLRLAPHQSVSALISPSLPSRTTQLLPQLRS